jgi:phosphatidate phosphatase PAH1
MRISKKGEGFFTEGKIYTKLLPSDTLKAMNLKMGENNLDYIYNYNMMKCKIFLYNYDQKFVVCDIDGTITKSDIIGLAQSEYFNWIHDGISTLFEKLSEMGVIVIYLTMRSIELVKYLR